MTTDKPTRVLLTLDSGALDADALRALTLLTGEGDVEISGIYIEDEDLYNAVQLPGMSEVSLTSGTVSSLDPDRIKAQITSQARRAREEFESSARRLKLKYSFQVTRGRTIETLVKVATPSDIVVVARSKRRSGLRTRHGTHLGPLVQQRENLLVVNEPWASGQSVVALCESDPGSCEQALTAARRVADAEDLPLVVAVPPDRNRLHDIDADRVITLRGWSEEAIIDVCQSEDARLLVLSPAADLDWRAILLRLVDRLSCSFLRLDQ